MNELRLGVPIKLDGLTLVPIERLQINAYGKSDRCWLEASKEPVALVICGLGEPFVVGVDAQELSFEDFIDRLPALDPLLQSLG